jgi:glycosyltransferase involved in cell wall biosynthesis
MPTLSICIPSYNRSALLVQALNAIYNQLTLDSLAKVEIIVSDNASSDNTRDTAAMFHQTHRNLPFSYFCQPRNLGADANIDSLLKSATGDFILLLSDDDILLPGAVDRLLQIIAAQPTVDAIGLNVKPFVKTVDETSQPIRNDSADRLITDRDEALGALGTWITFVSALAFRRTAMRSQGYTHRIGSNFIHSYVFLDVLAQGSCWLTHEPFLATRANNTGGYSFFQAFISDFASLLEEAVRLGFKRQTVLRLLKEHQAFIMNFVIAFKIQGSYGSLRPDLRDGLRRIWQVYRTDPNFLLRVTCLMTMPHSGFLALRGLRRRLKRRS